MGGPDVISAQDQKSAVWTDVSLFSATHVRYSLHTKSFPCWERVRLVKSSSYPQKLSFARSLGKEETAMQAMPNVTHRGVALKERAILHGF